MRPLFSRVKRGLPSLRSSILALIAMTSSTMIGAKMMHAALQHPHNYSYFNQALDPSTVEKSAVNWTSLTVKRGRPFGASDASNAGLAMTQAWRAFEVGAHSQNLKMLEDHFSGPALERASVAASESFVDGSGMVVLEQNASPEFFHLDGSMLHIETHDDIVARYRFNADRSELNFLDLSKECSSDILLKKTTGWKLTSHIRTCAQTQSLTEAANVSSSDLKLPLKGINYYPANHAWDAFWRDFDPVLIRADFSKMGDLGINAVRVFVPYEPFMDAEQQKTSLSQLRQLADIAAQNNLTLVPTLFDMHADYCPESWTSDYAYLKSVLGTLRGHEAVHFVDLKNEADLDFTARGKGCVMAWGKIMLTLARQFAPEFRYTIGWSNASNATELLSSVDFVSYHDYADPAGIKQRFDDVRARAGGKAIIISETGTFSWSTLRMNFPSSEAHQATVLQQQLDGLSNADGVFVWTLYDFDVAATKSLSRLPWIQRMQATFGLIDRAGNLKPAAKIFSNWTPRTLERNLP